VVGFHCFKKKVSIVVQNVIGNIIVNRKPIITATVMFLQYTQTTTTLDPFNSLFPRTTWVSWHQKGKPFWILLEQKMMGRGDISWTICKSFAPRFRQITMPVPHHLVFTGQMPFLPPNQQRQITEDRQCTQNAFK